MDSGTLLSVIFGGLLALFSLAVVGYSFLRGTGHAANPSGDYTTADDTDTAGAPDPSGDDPAVRRNDTAGAPDPSGGGPPPPARSIPPGGGGAAR